MHKLIRKNGTVLFAEIKEEYLFILLLCWIHLELSSLTWCLECESLCGGNTEGHRSLEKSDA